MNSDRKYGHDGVSVIFNLVVINLRTESHFLPSLIKPTSIPQTRLTHSDRAMT
jgi:hypothetical protein